MAIFHQVPQFLREYLKYKNMVLLLQKTILQWKIETVLPSVTWGKLSEIVVLITFMKLDVIYWIWKKKGKAHQIIQEQSNIIMVIAVLPRLVRLRTIKIMSFSGVVLTEIAYYPRGHTIQLPTSWRISQIYFSNSNFEQISWDSWHLWALVEVVRTIW